MKKSLAYQADLENQQNGVDAFRKTNEEIRNQVTHRLTYHKEILSSSSELKNTSTPENIKKNTILSCNPLEEKISYVNFLKQAPLIYIKTNSLQKWEGTVLAMGKDSFIARLHDLTSQNAEEEAEFPLEEVSEEDKQLLVQGALFYWDIGYRDNFGQRERISSIRFQRMPAWRVKDLEASKIKAAYIREKLGW